MRYKSIAILGIGTLGGFVANAIANFDDLETLIIMDHDVVERKNLRNSIYRNVDLGCSKVECLSEILKNKNSDLTVMSINERYIEEKTKIPHCDLVIDCRDYTYDRRKEIDVRLYISSRYLMLDCRKDIEYQIKTEGKYISEMTKEDLRYSASLFSMLLSNDTIDLLMKKQSVQKYELDYVKHIETATCDVVYDSQIPNEKFINLAENIFPIIEANKTVDLPVYVGSVTSPLMELTIPKCTIENSNDLVINLNSLVSSPCDFNNFVISFQRSDRGIYIELIPETGAA